MLAEKETRAPRVVGRGRKDTKRKRIGVGHLLCLAMVCLASLSSAYEDDAPDQDETVGPAISTLAPTELADASDDGPAKGAVDALGDIEVASGSRSMGGLPASIPPWLMNVWLQQNKPKFDGRHAGFGIRISDTVFLAHQDTCDYAESFPCDPQHNQPQLEFHLPVQINVTHGPAMENLKEPFKYRHYGCAIHTRLSHGFNLYYIKINHHIFTKKEDFYKDFYPERILHEELRLTEEPQWQNEPNVKDNCFIYSYSSGDQSPSKNEIRKFVKIPIHFHRVSETGHFLFDMYSAAACPWLIDAGAPILCGAKGKLSYVLDRVDDVICNRYAKATAIAPYYSKIMAARAPPKTI